MFVDVVLCSLQTQTSFPLLIITNNSFSLTIILKIDSPEGEQWIILRVCSSRDIPFLHRILVIHPLHQI